MVRATVNKVSLLLLVSLAWGCSFRIPSELPVDTPDTLIVGEVASMTGIEATYGLAAHQGISLAVREINAAGGVRGKKINLVTLDSQGNRMREHVPLPDDCTGSRRSDFSCGD